MKTSRQMMGLIAGLLFLVCLPRVGILKSATPVLRSLEFQDHFDSGKLGAWAFPFPGDWEILSEGPLHYLHMKRRREPGVPRRPLQFALLKDINMASFELETRVRRNGRSMIIVFGYVDTLHFYYAHLSGDRGSEQPVHNGVFIVDGAPRRRVAGLDAAPALPDREWHRIRLLRNALTGSIRVFVDDEAQPRFSLQDSTFTCGKVGLGSFDETGDFAHVTLTAHDVDCVSGNRFRVRPAKTE